MDLGVLYTSLEKKYAAEPEYLQAVKEVLHSVGDFYALRPDYAAMGIIERLVEPDRCIQFRVPWIDDTGKVHVNTGYRVQFSNAIGPYKGGIRFHANVCLGTMKFLAFEQVFKNALTTLPLGGGKGGADFDPKGKSPAEIMRFCHSFMLELWRVIGPDTDIPAGDIGVGAREVGFMNGMYKKIARENSCVFTGKGISWGGSRIRPEATGYGAVYFAEEMLKTRGQRIAGKMLAISGFGQVAWGAASKATEMGARVICISGPDGYVHIPEGMDKAKLDFMLALRASNQDIVQPFAETFKLEFFEGKKPWELPCDIAMPCAIQNELDATDAAVLVGNGCTCVCEGANMPCTPQAVELFQNKALLYSPGKASNAGGVAVSGLEMSQNAMRYYWASKDVDDKLRRIITDIHASCAKYGMLPDGQIDYVKGANIAGFAKVAEAMLEQGLV
jgi:glutamate dehydrogenase (NADP+)